MDPRRPNECPRCRFPYSAWDREHGIFGERAAKNLRDRSRQGWGPLGHARAADAEQTRPWRCRCGTWLRARAWNFGWVDIAGMAVLAFLGVLLAVRYSWMANPYVLGVPIALWFAYRVSSQFSVEEVPAEAAEKLAG
ncbi:MAG TPA: hypothetical protein VGK89_00485 [Candidatus Eisenbacteria bacterium]|jgi:hypothetical protein